MIPRVKGFYNCLQLSKYFKKLKIDLIHSFHYGSDYSEAFAANIAGIPWVFTKKKYELGWYFFKQLENKVIFSNANLSSK